MKKIHYYLFCFFYLLLILSPASATNNPNTDEVENKTDNKTDNNKNSYYFRETRPIKKTKTDKELYLLAIKNYLTKHYPTYVSTSSYFINGSGGKISNIGLKFLDKNNKYILVGGFLIKRKHNGTYSYKMYKQLSPRMTDFKVFAVMGKTFLRYYFKKELGKKFNCPITSSNTIYYYHRKKQKRPVILSFFYDKKQPSSDEKIESTKKFIDVYFKFIDHRWQIVRVKLKKRLYHHGGIIIKDITIGYLSSSTIKTTIDKIKASDYNQYIIF